MRQEDKMLTDGVKDPDSETEKKACVGVAIIFVLAVVFLAVICGLYALLDYYIKTQC